MGGLTVAHAIKELLPNERLVYFGDTKHLPYGEKSPEAITQYATGIIRYLLSRDCKAIVIACNSAATAAGHYIRDIFGDQIPLLDVVQPLVEEVGRNDFQRVGIIATQATIKSGVYQKGIAGLGKEIKVEAMATPLLVPMIEEGYIDNEVSKSILSNYLLHPRMVDVEALLLACTHYPLIRHHVQKWLPEAEILDSTVVTAAALKTKLEDLGLLASERSAEDEFIISDHTETFAAQRSSSVTARRSISGDDLRRPRVFLRS